LRRNRGRVRAGRAAGPSRLELLRALRKGRADGRAAITGPAPGWGQEVTGVEEAWTPFIGETRDKARAASNDLAAWLMDNNRPLVSKIFKQAEVVVWQHDSVKELTPGSRGRFVESLTSWRVAVAPARSRAESAVDRANQLIHCYWGAYLLGYRRAGREAALPAGWRPGTAVIDPYWAKPDPLLLLSFRPGDDVEDEATTRASGTLRRALEIISDCRCPMCKQPDSGDNGI
jgi:hypothetical protein